MSTIHEKQIKNILLDQSDLEDVFYLGPDTILNYSYNHLFQCKISITGISVPIIIGIPQNWETDLFGFYIIGYGTNKISNKIITYDDCPSFNTFIPHVAPDSGRLCLADIDTILIDPQFEGLFIQCLNIAREILYLGITKENQSDFINEFNSYWSELPYAMTLKLIKPQNDTIKWLQLFKTDNQTFIAGENPKEILAWTKETQQFKCLYLPFTSYSPIYPPDPRTPIDKSFFNTVLSKINPAQIRKLIGQSKRVSYVVFSISNHINEALFIHTIFGVFIKNGKIEKLNGIYSFTEESCFIPLAIKRIDKTFLMQRSCQNKNKLQTKKILIVGCGSIGGYTASLLAKTGCEQITLVDYDILTEENIYRHLLGKTYIDCSKVTGLKNYLNNSFPNIHIDTHFGFLQNEVEHNRIILSTYDYIFSLSGNENLNRWLENYLDIHSIKTKLIIGWNEPLDIGSHCVFVNTQNSGRYSSLFGYTISNNIKELCNLSSFTAPGQKITIENSGCGGTFIPYGSDISIRTALMCVDFFKRSEEGLLSTNIIGSQKGNGVYFERAGLLKSDVYNNQVNIYEEKELS